MDINLTRTPYAHEYLQSQFDILAATAFSSPWSTKLLTAAAVLPAESNIQRGHPYLQTTQREGERRNRGRAMGKKKKYGKRGVNEKVRQGGRKKIL